MSRDVSFWNLKTGICIRKAICYILKRIKSKVFINSVSSHFLKKKLQKFLVSLIVFPYYIGHRNERSQTNDKQKLDGIRICRNKMHSNINK